MSALSRHFRELAEQEKAAAERRLAAAADLESGAFADVVFRVADLKTKILVLLWAEPKAWSTNELGRVLRTAPGNVTWRADLLVRAGVAVKVRRGAWKIKQ